MAQVTLEQILNPQRSRRGRWAKPRGEYTGDIPRGAKVVALPHDLYAFVDAKHYEWITRHNWHVTGTGYPTTMINKRPYTMHRLLIFVEYGVWTDYNSPCDHVNRNKFDNRLSNLRLASPSTNKINGPMPIGRTGYRNITNPYDGHYLVKIIRNKKAYTASFDSLEDAIAHRDKVVKALGTTLLPAA